MQVNNGTVTEATPGTTINAGNTVLRFGDNNIDSVTDWMDGRIDEVGFWKRVLTPAERAQLYNGGAGLTYPFDGAAFNPGSFNDPGNPGGKGGPAPMSADDREGGTSACPCTQGQGGDPVNTRTGGFDFGVVDLSFPTSAGSVAFQRTYASPVTNTYTTTLGYGWTHNQDTRLVPQSGVIWFKAHSANQYQFFLDVTGGITTYTPAPGVFATLTSTLNTPVVYTLTQPNQAVYLFDAASFTATAYLTKWTDP